MTRNLDTALNSYDAASKSQKKSKTAKALGFSAAAACGLLVCGQAEADVIWSGPVGALIPDGVGYAFDIDGDGNNDIGVINVGATTATGRGFAFNGQGTKGGFGFMGNGAAAYPGALQNQASSGSVSNGQTFTAGTGWMGWASGGAATTDVWGAFASPGVPAYGFVGFQFNGSSVGGATNATMNAWVQLGLLYTDTDGDGTVNVGDSLTMLVVDWAYQNDPTSTNAGWIDGTNFVGAPGSVHFGAIPEPTGMAALGLLAMGAMGVRRRRSA